MATFPSCLFKPVAYPLSLATMLLSSLPWPVWAQPQTDSPGSSIVAPEYFLGPGDQLQITVLGYEEYTGLKLVPPDGTVMFPLIGELRISGKTPRQVVQELTKRLNVYLINPIVNVSLTNLRPIVVNIAGEVQRPGPYQLINVTVSSNTTGAITSSRLSGDSVQGNTEVVPVRQPTVTLALLQAGGVTRDADIRRVMVRRYSPDGKAPVQILNLWETITSEDGPKDLVLQDGDAVFVPKALTDNLAERRLLARSNLAPRTIRIRVAGEVKRPGEVEVQPNTTISGAVTVAGGPTDKAELNQVAYIRLADSGRVERQLIDITNFNDEYQVQDGDVIVVPKGSPSQVLDFLSLLFPLGLFQNFPLIR